MATEAASAEAQKEAAIDAGVATIAEQKWPVTVKLKYPITFGSASYAELVFPRGNVGVLKGLGIEGSPSVSQLLMIASRLTKVPVAALELLDPDDSPEVIELALIFFGRCLGIGRTS